ncbi:MAG: cysteine-rich KTR domain-containing protein [Firmicutes bacterium]|nr:cysteine-rich KTR domain-containing protein [Bacillota bacterium]
MNKMKWLLCPICNSKTRLQLLEDTVLENFPLHCPKCKQTSIIEVKKFIISVVKEPVA